MVEIRSIRTRRNIGHIGGGILHSTSIPGSNHTMDRSSNLVLKGGTVSTKLCPGLA